MTKSPLPLGILKSDCDYPKWKENMTEKERNARHIVHNITLYNTTCFGWVVATLHISNANRRINQTTARTYAVMLNGNTCRVGNGPHVTETVTVHVRQDRLKALQPLVDLYQKGAIEANEIRDRRSSRIAEGSIRRARGERSWRWSF